jgi:hypothetical protein
MLALHTEQHACARLVTRMMSARKLEEAPPFFQVLSCPPESCLEEPDTCSETLRFTANGIKECGVNTDSEVIALACPNMQ